MEYLVDNNKSFYPLFFIQTKEQGVKRFQPNFAQQTYLKKKTNRDLILKARQLGITTQIKMDDLDFFLKTRGTTCVTIADVEPHAKEIFRKILYGFKYLDKDFKKLYELRRESTREMYSETTDNLITVLYSARSTTAHRLHVSEFCAMRPNQKEEILLGSIPAVPKNGYAVIETTARGEDQFKMLWDEAKKGKNEWNPIFLGWYYDKSYKAKIPEEDKYWKMEYQMLAKQYNLIEDLSGTILKETDFKITDEQWYWYYRQARAYHSKVVQEYPSTDREAFLSTGSSVFSIYILQNKTGQMPIMVKNNGELKIWKEPEEKHRYIIGIDCSEGDINSDYGVCCVLDTETCEQVAEMRGKWKDNIHANKAAKLGIYYNNAMLAVERNNHGHSVLSALKHTEQYRNLFIFDRRYGGDDKLGWLTSGRTKPLILTGAGGLVEAVEEGQMTVNSEEFLGECRSFQYSGDPHKHGMGAIAGHDDLVMGWAIAWYVRKFVPKAAGYLA